MGMKNEQILTLTYNKVRKRKKSLVTIDEQTYTYYYIT